MADAQDRLSCDAFDAWIVVDGVKSNVYGVEHKGKEGIEEASCWISSEKDKEFAISFRLNPDLDYEYAAQVKLDGHTVSDRLYPNEKATQTHTISTVSISATEFRKFAFGSLEWTDDDEHLEDPSAQNIGEITLILDRINSRTLVEDIPVNLTYGLPDLGKVHERSKRGLAHQVSYLAVQDVTPESEMASYDCEYHGDSTKFFFKYRPFAMLQAIGIIPCIPPAPLATKKSSSSRHSESTSSPAVGRAYKRKISAVKTEIRDDQDDLEDDVTSEDDRVEEKEVLDELARISKERELLARLARIRSRQRARKGTSGPSQKKIKTEPKTYFTPGEIVDLT